MARSTMTRDVDVAATAAKYATSVTLSEVPDPVREQMILVLLDTVGVCIRGSETAYVKRAAEAAATFGRGPLAEGGATVFATGDRRDVPLAALLNAAGGTTLELDEGNQQSAHPGIHTVPPALAAGEHLKASGQELLDALVAGYEVGARLGEVIRPMREGLHPHGGWAPISAAVAVGRLREFDADTMAQGIRIAVTPFIVGHWRAALEGASIRNFYTGLACQHGLMAAELAGSGVTGINGAIEECLLPYTTANEVTADLLAPFETFGSEYYLTSSYFKIHAACRYTHAPIEALTVIHERVNFNPGDVKRIQVRTFERGTLLDRTNPDTVLAAKFSTPFALATRIQTGRSDAEAFTPNRVGDPAIQALAERVEIIPDEEFEARAVDGQWGAHVVVELTDGTRHAEAVQDARGGGNAPFTREVVYEKFDSLVDTQLASDQRTTLRRRLLNIECGDNVGTLLEPLRVDTQ